MLFNSDEFLKFFGSLLLLYWLVRRHLTARNALLLAASYVFYGWWDARFLLLLIASTLLDYFVGIGLAGTPPDRKRRRAWLLTASVAGNLGILGFFKYFGFFAASLAEALGAMGWSADLPTLQIVLPVGISFYTFQTMSYSLDIYRGQMKPTRDFLAFAAYVAFFPQLVAGPIERARHLLPQFESKRSITIDMLREGLWLGTWGLFKKVVLADNLAPLVDRVFENPQAAGPAVTLATIAFGLQIYCDFSGYSDMARGLAKLLGFNLVWNFSLPYFATSPREFWRRWHISLSTWLRDYVYIPLGGNRKGRRRTVINLLTTMSLGGLWHGAAWHFVAWGVWHGIGLAAQRAWPRRPNTSSSPSRPGAFFGWGATMAFVFLGWLLFRAESIAHVGVLIRSAVLAPWPDWTWSYSISLAMFSLPLLAVECWQARSADLLAPLKVRWPARALIQGGMLAAVILFWETDAAPFIYFQF